RRLPLLAAERFRLALDGIEDGLEAHLIGPEHRTAAVDREPVTVDPDDIHLERALGDPLFEGLGALVYHHVEAALKDCLVADLPRGDALLLAELLDQAVHLGIRSRGAAAGLVLVDTGASLLAQRALLGELVQPAGGHVLAGRATLLADTVADADAGQVRHGELAHGETEVEIGRAHV